METLQLIYKIASSPEVTNVVIKDEQDRTPMQAIERLAFYYPDEKDKDWRVNSSLEKNTFLIY